MRIESWIDQAMTKLSGLPHPSARLDAFLLVQSVMNHDKAWVLAHMTDNLAQSDHIELEQLLSQRASGVPMAYILGNKEFYGRNFYVSNDVLIPRPESEAIIEALLSESNKLDSRDQIIIIDVGTGSGCLAITAKLEIPDAVVYATDISEPALRAARKNSLDNKAEVTMLHGNLLNPVIEVLGKSSKVNTNTFLLANLPYVPDGFSIDLSTAWEPSIALFGGNDGLDYYRAMIEQINSTDWANLRIITESLESQHNSMVSLFSKHNFNLECSNGLVQLFHRNAPSSLERTLV